MLTRATMYEDHKLHTNFFPCLQVGPSAEDRGLAKVPVLGERVDHLWPQVYYVERERHQGWTVKSKVLTIFVSGCWVDPVGHRASDRSLVL